MTWISRAALARGDLQQEQQSTEGNEDNEGFLLRNPNWIFVFCVIFCKNLFDTDFSGSACCGDLQQEQQQSTEENEGN
jgi:hypothetical protein